MKCDVAGNMENIEVGQVYIGIKNSIKFEVVRVTKKSVTVVYEMQLYYHDYPKTYKNCISKEQLLKTTKKAA